MSKLERKKVKIPTYPIGEGEPLPLFFEKRPYQGASGRLYPIPFVSSFSDEKIDKEYDGITLENKYIRVLLLPEIGGKIHSALDKTNGYDFIYHNKVIKPAMVGLAGPWVSGGIEFNWPQHHRPTTFMPVDVSVGENNENNKNNENGEKCAYMGEVDYFHGMKGMVKVSVDDEHSYIKAEVTVYNSTPVAQPFMWWANLAVEVNKDYKIVFPPDVEHVNDHDRRAVLEWPIAKGVYQTARPFDYGNGTDIHEYSAVKVPCSFLISKGQSNADFVSGYDAGKGCGVVTVANHHVAPGKKLWTWGDSNFGAKWCANLTDDGSKYVELMTGCYTDNQPDFTWIAPYETKTFEQFWYPVKDIGETKSATIEAACNLERRENGGFVGVYTTSLRKNCRVIVSDGDKTVFEATADISPERAYVSSFGVKNAEKLSVRVLSEEGETLVSWTEHTRGKKAGISPRLPAERPENIKTTEELWLNGIHLVQYKHFAYRPEDYFQEGLKRDEGDARCNESMGDLCLNRGEFDRAIAYYNRAIERLTLRNFNPYNTDPYYKRALCSFYKGELQAAYDDAYTSVWSYPQRTAGYYLLAKIEALRGNRTQSIGFLNEALETNAKHVWAKYALMLLSGEEGAEEKISACDPLFFARLDTEKNAIKFAVELMQFGLYGEAEKRLAGVKDGAMKYYYLAYLAFISGDENKANACVSKADACPWQREFPSKKESIAVLKRANTPMARYYLGCIYYNFERFEDACAEWEKTVAELDFAPAYRNLSLAYFDHLNRADEAKAALEKAFELYPESGRIFYELTQLYKSLNVPIKERIALYENHAALTAERDDCTLAYSVLCTVAGDYEKARDILRSHRFHTYEGGEGYLTQHHAWLQFLIAKELMKKGDYVAAKAELEAGLTFPENYGEEKNYFVNDAPIYYLTALCEERLGNTEAAEKNLALADSTKGAPTVHSYFQCLALKKAGKEQRAEALARELIAMGEKRIANADVNDYYGVGAPAYPPFGYDIVKAHVSAGNLLCAFGYLAAGERNSAVSRIAEVKKKDEADFSAYLFEQLL